MEKNEKDLRSLCERFGKEGQTLLAFYATEEQRGGYYAIGEVFRVANGITAILENGMKTDATEDEESMAFSILEGMRGLLEKRNVAAITFMGMLMDIMEDIRKQLAHTFDPESKECVGCDHYEECLRSHTGCDAKCN